MFGKILKYDKRGVEINGGESGDMTTPLPKGHYHPPPSKSITLKDFHPQLQTIKEKRKIISTRVELQSCVPKFETMDARGWTDDEQLTLTIL